MVCLLITWWPLGDHFFVDSLTLVRWFFVHWSHGDHHVIICPLIAWQPFSNSDSFNCLMVANRLCFNCAFFQCFPVDTKYSLFDYCSFDNHLGARNICYWNDDFVEFNDVLNFIVNTSFLFLGTYFGLTCGKGVNFFLREFGRKDNIIKGGLFLWTLSFMIDMMEM
jgi:hypothetical protein